MEDTDTARSTGGPEGARTDGGRPIPDDPVTADASGGDTVRERGRRFRARFERRAILLYGAGTLALLLLMFY